MDAPSSPTLPPASAAPTVFDFGMLPDDVTLSMANLAAIGHEAARLRHAYARITHRGHSVTVLAVYSSELEAARMKRCFGLRANSHLPLRPVLAGAGRPDSALP